MAQDGMSQSAVGYFPYIHGISSSSYAHSSSSLTESQPLQDM